MSTSRANRFDLPELNFEESFFREPHQTLARLRQAGARAAFVPRMGTIMLLDYADVHAALLNRDFGAIGSAYYEQ